MTATPDNGKDEDFQLFMALVDGDRFEGRFRDGVHTADVSDLMRRMVKEGLLKFAATPLFPERHAYTVAYKLSDRETGKLGYDVESRIPGTGRLRFIEVKGRVTGADTITVTKNEILYSLNKPDDFILAIVEFMDGDTHRAHYVRRPFHREPDFGVTSVNYDFSELLSRGEAPS